VPRPDKLRFQFENRSQLFIRAHVSARPLRDQIHRERMNRPLKFDECSSDFLGTHDERCSVANAHLRSCTAARSKLPKQILSRIKSGDHPKRDNRPRRCDPHQPHRFVAGASIWEFQHRMRSTAHWINEAQRYAHLEAKIRNTSRRNSISLW